MNRQFDITIDKGADFHLSFTLTDASGTPVDLREAEVLAQIREYSEASDKIDITATNNGEGGRISLVIPYEVTSEISFSKGVYDVFTIKNGVKKKWLFGNVKVNPSVTR